MSAGRPTKIQVVKKQNGYEITCIDEITGSATGMDIPTEGYEALKQHFETGSMEVSSDEISNCTTCKHVLRNDANRPCHDCVNFSEYEHLTDC